MWPINPPSPDGTAKPWSYGDRGSVMEVGHVKPLTSLHG